MKKRSTPRPQAPGEAAQRQPDEQLEQVRPAAFLMHATSPGNHQAWIAVDGLPKTQSKDFIRRVLSAVGDADKSAPGATRLAGTFNFKEKYLPEPPLVSIVQGVPEKVMTGERIQGLGLLAESGPIRMPPARAAVLRSAFATLTPVRRNSYIFRVSSAKRAKTRAARAEECVPMILSGRGFNELPS